MTGISLRRPARYLGSAGIVAALLGSTAWAGPIYLTPNTTTGLGPVNVLFNGETFINQGLVGAGRLSSSLLDFNGETLGSFSGMAVKPGSWKKTGDTYSGTVVTLPDRGFNSGTVFSDYAARLQKFDLTFTPYTGAANLPLSPTSQNQLTFAYDAKGSMLLRDFNGNPTTGNNPGANTIVQDGHVLPSPAAGKLGAGKVSMDAEAVSFLPNGTFYVGDEYSGSVYYFNKAGKMIGYIDPTKAIEPQAGGVPNFGVDLNTTGRRTNQGMEGVSVSPDGKSLFAVLQSATLQDSTGSQESRLNTRVLVYDISSDKTPDSPVGHYVLQLPTLDRDGTGPNADRTAAQSEVLSLNDHQFLLLTRDGNGLGVDDGRPIVFKSIFLVDTSVAATGGAPSNLAGTAFETGTTPVAPGGVLSPSIKSLSTAELVNMLNTDQLTHLGLTNAVTNVHPLVSTNMLSEKWESLGLFSVLDPSAPNDYFLFIGNDNDFGTLSGTMSELSTSTGDPSGSGAYSAGVVNDNLMLVYRVTLPNLERSQIPEPAGLALFAGVGLMGWVRQRARRV